MKVLCGQSLSAILPCVKWESRRTTSDLVIRSFFAPARVKAVEQGHLFGKLDTKILRADRFEFGMLFGEPEDRFAIEENPCHNLGENWYPSLLIQNVFDDFDLDFGRRQTTRLEMVFAVGGIVALVKVSRPLFPTG